MNTTVWNCQGLGIDLTVRRLNEIHKKYIPDMLCLLETKQKDDVIRGLACELGYGSYVTHVLSVNNFGQISIMKFLWR